MANVYIDALAGKSWLTAGFDQNITYAFDDTGLRAWTDVEKAAFTAALQTWSHVADITFTLADDAASAEMSERLLSASSLSFLFGSGTIGAHSTPSESGKTTGYFGGGFNPYALGYTQPVPGSSIFNTFVHELGHALGLAHPHDTGQGTTIFPGVDTAFDTGDDGLNQTVYTVMSYNDFGLPTVANGNVAGPMAFDIAAIQQLYGANTLYRAGDDTYDLNDFIATTGNVRWECIWDTGGHDVILGSSSSADLVIDLRPATLQVGEGAGGFVSRVRSDIEVPGWQGGLTIANGVVIEDANGGSGNDEIGGNDAANMLFGALGNDRLFGRGADDELFGNEGNDCLYGGAGSDVLWGGVGNDTYVLTGHEDIIIENPGDGTDYVSVNFSYVLGSGNNVEGVVLTGQALSATGNSAANVLWGNTLANTLTGGAGNDRLVGQAGKDVLIGGAGNDTYDVGETIDTIREYNGGGLDTVRAGRSYNIADLAHIENLTLYAGPNMRTNQFGIGNSGANVITGTEWDNLLDGRGGADTMKGGRGSDTYYVDSAKDVIAEASSDIYGGENLDIDEIRSGSLDLSLAKYAHVENATLLGTRNLKLTGAGSENKLTGNAGDNLIIGGGAKDVLTGGAGRDVFKYQAMFESANTQGFDDRDTITDFRHGVDKIDLSSIDADTYSPGNNAFAFMPSGIASNGVLKFKVYAASGNAPVWTEVTFNDGNEVGKIKLLGVSALTASDFIL